MAHQQQAARALGQRLLQAFDRRQVQVVGRLVHHDEVAALHDGHRQQDLADLAGRRQRGLEHGLDLRAEAADDGEDAAEAVVVQPAEVGEHALRVGGGDFLGHVEHLARRQGKLLHDVADERALAGAVGAHEGHPPVAGHEQFGQLQHGPAGAHLDPPGRHAKQPVPPAAGFRQPDAQAVLLDDADGRQRFGGLAGPARQLPQRGAALAIGDAGAFDLLPGVVVAPGELPLGSQAGLGGGAVAAVDHLAFDPAELALGLGALAAEFLDLQLRLRPPLGVAAAAKLAPGPVRGRGTARRARPAAHGHD